MLCTRMINGNETQPDFLAHAGGTQTTTPTSILAMDAQHNDAHSQKRGRGDDSSRQQLQQQQQQQQQHQHQIYQHQTYGQPTANAIPLTPVAQEEVTQGSMSKRSRPNNYEAPRTVPPSILTAMGSLVGGSISNGSTNNPGLGSQAQFVPFRRRLSGGALEQFIGGHDTMDTDNNEYSRPRSMSL